MKRSLVCRALRRVERDVYYCAAGVRDATTHLPPSRGDFTVDNFTKIVQYTPVLMDSLRLAFYCTVLCLLIGYPTAYFMASQGHEPGRVAQRAHTFAHVDELPFAHIRDDDIV